MFCRVIVFREISVTINTILCVCKCRQEMGEHRVTDHGLKTSGRIPISGYVTD